MTREVAATLNLDIREASVVDAALRYYADTWLHGDDDIDTDEDKQDVAIAERTRLRLRKSVERHGYTFRSRL